MEWQKVKLSQKKEYELEKNQRKFREAVMTEDIEKVRSLLTKNYKYNLQKALSYAVNKQNIELCSLLLDEDISVFYEDNILIKKVIYFENVEILQLLLQKASDEEQDSEDINYLFTLAIDTRNLDLVKVFLEFYTFDIIDFIDLVPDNIANYFIREKMLNLDGFLVRYLYEGSTYRAEYLLDDETLTFGADDQLATAIAFEQGFYDVADRLLDDHRFDPGFANDAALVRATDNLVPLGIFNKLLNDPRVDVNARGGRPIMNLSIYGGRREMIEALLNHPDMNYIPFYALLTAQYGGFRDIVELFLDDIRLNPYSDETGNDRTGFGQLINDHKKKYVNAETRIRNLTTEHYIKKLEVEKAVYDHLIEDLEDLADRTPEIITRKNFITRRNFYNFKFDALDSEIDILKQKLK